DLVVVNKLDLLPHIDFDLDKLLYNIESVHPGIETMLTSARTGAGMGQFKAWLAAVAARVPVAT
ncbi:MAG TPA: hypothetical protein VM712_07830, partial [Gaiellales bacterium]|nr:hypothetical protein [Gaiellales bacterium]